MAAAQAMLAASKYADEIDEYFGRPADDEFHQPAFVYPEQQKPPKATSTKSKPRKNKRSGTELD